MSGTLQGVSVGDTALVPMPAHVAGDWLFLAVETTSGTVTTPSGWSPRSSTANGTANSTWTLFQRKVGVGETVPSAALAGGSNHLWGVSFCVRDLDPSDPILNLSVWYAQVSSTSHALPGLEVVGQSSTLVIQGLTWLSDNAGPLLTTITNTSLTGLTEVFDSGTITADGGGIALAAGTLASPGLVKPADVVTLNSPVTGFCIAFRNAPAAVTTPFSTPPGITAKDFDGNPAANGGTVYILDTVLGTIETTATITGGDGSYSAAMRFNDANRYRSFYDNGVDPPGCSALWTAV